MFFLDELSIPDRNTGPTTKCVWHDALPVRCAVGLEKEVKAVFHYPVRETITGEGQRTGVLLPIMVSDIKKRNPECRGAGVRRMGNPWEIAEKSKHLEENLSTLYSELPYGAERRMTFGE